MSVSSRERMYGRLAFAYLCVAIGTAAVGFIYEQFSHGVWSAAMVYAFAIPLCGGALPFGTLALWGRGMLPPFACACWHLGLATLTVGSLFFGVLAIYGTTNSLVCVYFLAGGVLCAAAAVQIWLAKRQRS